MANTLGIHWVATTHGTWLHGDVRGSWKNGQLAGPDPFLEDTIRVRMARDAVVLNDTEIICIAATVGQIVVEQQHRVYAATFCATHLHVIFAPLSENIKTTIARLKKRTANVILAVRRTRSDNRKHLWTQGQFPVFIYDQQHLNNAIKYVQRHNQRIGLKDDPYDWIAPPPSPPGQDGRAI